MLKKIVYKILSLKNKCIYLIKKNSFILFSNKQYKRELKVKLNYDWSQYPNRTDLIQSLIQKHNYRSYLEIGCDHNQNFSKIKINKKIGVDPIRGGTFRGTSDEFFKQTKQMFDIIFIDGLHTEEQVLIDIENSLKHLNENGILILHDCIPTSFLEQHVPRIQESWTGSVWRAIVKVRQMEHIDTATIIADHGISIILKRDNINQLPKINSNDLTFSNFSKHHKKWLNCIEYKNINEWISVSN
ncbi:MAG: class I SAM-dependent methyltransferase [Candidatus Margulisiibacteriota bacterium]